MERSREQVLAERKRRKADKLSKKKGMASSIEKKLEDGHPSLCIAADVDSVTPTCNYSGKIVSGSELTKMTNELDESLVTLKLNHLTLNESNENGKAKSVILTGSTSKGPAEDGSTRTKAQLRAERRAKQDAQRVAKAAKKKRVQDKVESEEKLREDTVMIEPKTVNDDKNVSTNNMHRIKLFSHLYRESSIEDTKILMTSTTPIHKSVIKLGVQYRNKIVVGSNARVVALLNTLKQVLSDYKTPAEKDFSRGFEIVLASTTTYLEACRPISVSMFNALKHLKWLLSQLPNTVSDNEAQNKLREAIDDYIKEQIDMAGKAICIMVQKKISEGDVILTFGHSSLIERILIETLQVGITFRVIIVDAGPLYEGKELLRRLSRHGLNCVYVLLSATSYIMREASKVLLGAHALLTNGYVMSRAGSSQVALIAKSYNVPVLVCCETHKFSERVQTDAFVYNEMGDPEEFMDGNIWKCNNYLTPLTLMYDVTPSDLVTAVVTELAVLPCTSVPVVLRVKPANTTL